MYNDLPLDAIHAQFIKQRNSRLLTKGILGCSGKTSKLQMSKQNEEKGRK
jgi:hypothetical protein